MTCLTGPERQLDVTAAGLLADALTALIPAKLAGTRASAIKRAIERPNTGRTFMVPPSKVIVPQSPLVVERKCFGASQMNVQLSHGGNRPVLWQENARRSRCAQHQLL